MVQETQRYGPPMTPHIGKWQLSFRLGASSQGIKRRFNAHHAFLCRSRNAFAPSGYDRLTATRDRKRIGLDRLGDHRARADIGAVADRHRRDQGRVRADEGAGADVGPVLGEAVVIAGDGSGADVRFGADPRIADIGQMVDLGALLDRRLLDLNEIANFGVDRDVRARPEPRVRPDDRAAGDPRALEMREGVG